MRKLLAVVALACALFFSQSELMWAGGHKPRFSAAHAASSCCSRSSSDVHVRSYTRKSGTRVQSYHRTAPNSTQRDNFSAKGNTNPYTGQAGTKKVTH